MTILSTTFLALSMSADAFAVAVGKGAKLRHPHLKEAVRTGLIFGVIEAITPLIGWTLGSLANTLITTIDHWIAFSILVLLGIKMIHEGFQQEETPKSTTRNSFKALVLAGIGSSIDAMGVGVTLAFVNANIWITAAAIGTATFTMATIGFMIGHIIGNRTGKRAEAIGGLILIGIGTKILLEHTNFL